MLQIIPPQNQPIDESGSGVAMDRSWYRYLQSIFTNFNSQASTIQNQGNEIQSLSTSLSNLRSSTFVIVPVPPHNTSPGVPNQVAYDSGFFYVCIANNSWARAAIGGTW